MQTRTKSRFILILLFIGLTPFLLVRLADASADDKVNASETKRRTFSFKYSAVITGLNPGQNARIWIPVPPTNEDQEVRILSKELPGKEQIASEPKFGNQVLYVEGKADEQGMIPLSITF